MKKIAAIQMCSSNILEDNLIKAATLINEAAQNGAQMIVLPEMFPIMGNSSTDKVKFKEEYQHGPIQTFLAQQALQNNVWIIGGTIPIICNDPNKVRAACLVFNDSGECVARYDKIHLFDISLSQQEKYNESATTEAGKDIVVFDSPLGKIGLAVCYDIRFPELFRYLFNKGAEIFILPSAFTVPTGQAHWEILTRSRAIENFCYLVAACQGGTHSNGRKTYGHSIIIEPWGNIASQSHDDAESIIYSIIDLNKVHEARESIPINMHQKFLIELDSNQPEKKKSSWNCLLF